MGAIRKSSERAGELRKPRGSLPGVHGNTRYRERDILAAVRRAAKAFGNDVTLHEFQRMTGVGPTMIQSRFGGWIKLRERAGLPPRTRALRRARVHSQESLLERLLRARRAFGPQVTLMQFCQFAEVSSTTVAKYFGGWRQMRAAAGLPSVARRTPKVREVQLMCELYRVVQRIGHFPTCVEIDREACYSYQTYAYRYGSIAVVQQRYDYFLRRLAQAQRNLQNQVGSVTKTDASEVNSPS